MFDAAKLRFFVHTPSISDSLTRRGVLKGCLFLYIILIRRLDF